MTRKTCTLIISARAALIHWPGNSSSSRAFQSPDRRAGQRRQETRPSHTCVTRSGDNRRCVNCAAQQIGMLPLLSCWCPSTTDLQTESEAPRSHRHNHHSAYESPILAPCGAIHQTKPLRTAPSCREDVVSGYTPLYAPLCTHAARLRHASSNNLISFCGAGDSEQHDELDYQPPYVSSIAMQRELHPMATLRLAQQCLVRAILLTTSK